MGKPDGARRLPVGAEVLPGGGAHFRVWAPRHEEVEVVLEDADAPRGAPPTPRAVPLAAEGGGYFSGVVPEARAGTLYRYRLGSGLYPDPASRFQPEGPFGPSEIVDPARFAWTDSDWTGPDPDDRVIYELHVGTFTPEGTWRAAEAQLPALADLGVTILEVLPVGDFPGRFGWGYDGVDLFAPTRLYGPPDDMRRFVDRAHRHKLAVIIDVIYNHFGPAGSFLNAFSDQYLSKRHATEWGQALNYDDEGSAPVREFVLANAGYWVDEFHLDGLRIDASQSMFDDSPEHILAAIGDRVRASARGRQTFIVAESEPQDTRVVRPASQGGHGLDAIWSEDFHHVAMIAATGHREAYYADYGGTPQEFVSMARSGTLYQGQWNPRQGKRRGSPTAGLGPGQFVNYLQNHDQVANTGRGERFHRLTDPGQFRALSALFLLVPGTPMLFQGQEFAASSPFFYFGDQEPEIAERMYRGRQDFLSQFPNLATAAMKSLIPRPEDPATFARSKLDPTERERAHHAEAYALHRDLLRLRRGDPAFRDRRPGRLEGAVLGPGAFVLRYLGAGGGDRLLVVNLGRELALSPPSEPLLAPPAGALWDLLWSSEDPRYGGGGIVALTPEETWTLTGHSAIVMKPVKVDETPNG